MFKSSVLPTRTWKSTLRRHHLFSYANTSLLFPSSPSLSPAQLTISHQLQNSPSHIIPTRAQFHSTPRPASPLTQTQTQKNIMGATRGKTETGAETGEIRDSTEDWKQKPPYRTTEGNEHFEKKFTAHCHCGRVRYWLSRDKPLACKFCHCVDCQGLHGAPFQWAAIFHKEDLHFEKGAEGLAFYHSPDKTTQHTLPVKVSCAYCHTPIMDEGRNMVLMFPGIIKFSDAEHKKLFDPQCHIFYSQRVVDIHDGKPKWSKLDNQSELIKEIERREDHTVLGEPRIEHTKE